MTYEQAKARKAKLEARLEHLEAAYMRTTDLGQVFSQTDGDARNEIERINFPALANEMRKIESEIAKIDDLIAQYEGRIVAHKRDVRMRGV